MDKYTVKHQDKGFVTKSFVKTLQVLRIKREVMTIPHSFVERLHSLLWDGIRPILVSVDSRTLNTEPQCPRLARPRPYPSIQRHNQNGQQPVVGVDSAKPEFWTRPARSTLQFQLDALDNRVFLQAKCASGRRKSKYAGSNVDGLIHVPLAVCVRHVSRYVLIPISMVAV